MRGVSGVARQMAVNGSYGFTLAKHLMPSVARRAKDNVLELMRKNGFKELHIEQGALIGEGKWAAQFFQELKKRGVKQVDLEACIQHSDGPIQTVLCDKPNISRIRGAFWILDEKKSPTIELLRVGLTPKKIGVLAELMARASHAAEYTIKR